jgi:hypothetical protein
VFTLLNHFFVVGPKSKLGDRLGGNVQRCGQGAATQLLQPLPAVGNERRDFAEPVARQRDAGVPQVLAMQRVDAEAARGGIGVGRAVFVLER